MPPEPVFGVKKILPEQRFAPDRTVPNWYSCPKKFFPVRAYRSMSSSFTSSCSLSPS